MRRIARHGTQNGKRNTGNRKQETGNRTPLAERLTKRRECRRFSSQETNLIMSMRDELAAKGLKDRQISQHISEKTVRSISSIRNILYRLIDRGKIPPNKNEPKSNADEILFIIQRRMELAELGMNDNQISKKIANEMGKDADCIVSMIWRMVRDGKLPENQNKKKIIKFTSTELATIIKRRISLSENGMTDNQISSILAESMRRSPKTIYGLMRRLVNTGELAENKNKHEKKIFSKDEIRFIVRKRMELVLRGINDSQIAELVSKEIGRRKISVQHLILRMVKHGELPENVNKHESREFTEAERDHIALRRQELATRGLKDYRIAKIIGEEIKRNDASVSTFIRCGISKGHLPENANKQKIFSKDEQQHIIRRRLDLINEGLTDLGISKKIGVELGRSNSSVYAYIVRIVKEGEVDCNPNKQERFQEDELSYIRQKRQELMAAEGLNDWQISRKLADELRKRAGSVNSIIRRLVKENGLPENPNKKSVHPTDKERLLALSQAAEAMEQFGERI